MEVVNLTCPGCGDRLSIDMKECPSCGGPVVISTLSRFKSMPPLQINKYANGYRKALEENPDNKQIHLSVAMCYLKLKLYDKAIASFEKAIEDNYDNSEAYFYAAICLLEGKKAFVQQRGTIDKIVEYLNAANMIEPKGIYYYFLAYIKYDFFARKFYKTSPDYKEELLKAKASGVTDTDVFELFEYLGVEKPTCL